MTKWDLLFVICYAGAFILTVTAAGFIFNCLVNKSAEKLEQKLDMLLKQKAENVKEPASEQQEDVRELAESIQE